MLRYEEEEGVNEEESDRKLLDYAAVREDNEAFLAVIDTACVNFETDSNDAAS